jgi:hypothetical protein
MQPIDGPLAKVRRAYSYILQFQREYERTAGGGIPLVSVATTFDAADSSYVLRVREVRAIPLAGLFLLDEAAHHLRSALDYLLFAVALADSGTEQPSTQFPLLTNPRHWDEGRIGKRTQDSLLAGVSGPHREAIKSHQPWHGWRYRGRLATHPLKTLNDLNNDNKHRFIQGAYVSITRLVVRPGTESNCRLDRSREYSGVIENPDAIAQPLQAQMELARVPVVVTAPNHDLRLDVEADPYIAFRNGIGCVNLLQTASYVRAVIREFSSVLRDPELLTLWQTVEGRFKATRKPVLFVMRRHEGT